MNILEIGKYAIKKIIRDKKNVFFLIILIICSLVLMGSITYRNFYILDLDNKVNSDIVFRTLYVNANSEEIVEHYEDENYDYGFNKISILENVLEVFDINYYRYTVVSPSFKNSIYDGTVNLIYGTQNTLPRNIYGASLDYNSTGVAICPMNFYPSLLNDSSDLNNFIDGKEILNTNFTIDVSIIKNIDGKDVKTNEKYKKTFKIIGLYDSNGTSRNPYDCFISAKDIQELYNVTLGETNNKSLSSQLVVVDNQKNVELVKNEITNMGFNVKLQAFINNDFINNLNQTCIIIISITIGALSFLTFLYLKKKNFNDNNEFGILKVVGYQNKFIEKLSVIQMLIITIISYIISIIFYEIIIIFINYFYLDYFLYQNIYIIKNYSSYIISFIIILIIPLILNYLFVKFRLKTKPIILLKGNTK